MFYPKACFINEILPINQVLKWMFNPEIVESKIQLIESIFGFVELKYFQFECFILCIHVGEKTFLQLL